MNKSPCPDYAEHRLNARFFHKLEVGYQKRVQRCPPRDGLRGDAWPEDRPLREKLYGDLAELKRTAAFVWTTRVDV